jgi:hypothetical protein
MIISLAWSPLVLTVIASTAALPFRVVHFILGTSLYIDRDHVAHSLLWVCGITTVVQAKERTACRSG